MIRKINVRTKNVNKENSTNKENQIYHSDLDLVEIGSYRNIVKTKQKSILFKLGTTDTGLAIETYLPKSYTYLNLINNNICIPLWLAKDKGIGWYLESKKLVNMDNATLLLKGFERAFNDNGNLQLL